ncbi:hypothetical protein BDV98DRAFT_605806 [Pterulicium gracile]|uniref:Uncharacterized protein n=1 Tax=Pterulicium gracile TaxID=1884261 RepID=A0A5C3QC41_9AGAR|nr:hypothetical protein BDV98DRAFT_605806 [Pterula gracilis]
MYETIRVLKRQQELLNDALPQASTERCDLQDTIAHLRGFIADLNATVNGLTDSLAAQRSVTDDLRASLTEEKATVLALRRALEEQQSNLTPAPPLLTPAQPRNHQLPLSAAALPLTRDVHRSSGRATSPPRRDPRERAHLARNDRGARD